MWVENIAFRRLRLLNESPNARVGLPYYEVLVQGGPAAPKTIQIIAVAIGYLPEIHSETIFTEDTW